MRNQIIHEFHDSVFAEQLDKEKQQRTLPQCSHGKASLMMWPSTSSIVMYVKRASQVAQATKVP